MAYTPQIYYPQSAFNQYQQPYQPQQIQQPSPAPQPQQSSQGLIWVSGEVGAKSYLMAPSSTVMLMDSEQSRFFIKQTDSAGMPSLRIFDYKEVTGVSQPQNPAQTNLSEQFVTRKEYEAICGKYEELKGCIEDMQKTRPSAKKKEVTADE